jgi:hypothetical protein
MFTYAPNQVEVKNTVVPSTTAASSDDINGTAIDLANYDGGVLVSVYSTDLSAGSANWLVEESETGTGDWTEVAAAALVDPATGEADTFTDASTSGIVQETLAVKKEVCKRFLRVTVDPTGATGSFTAYITGMKRNY